MFAWKQGLKTGQYYMRSKAARDAIQFTIDTETVGAKNQSKAEMDAQKKLLKKRPITETSVPQSNDLNKKRKVTIEVENVEQKKPMAPVAEVKPTGAEKPWEGKEEEELDARWDICENCQ